MELAAQNPEAFKRSTLGPYTFEERMEAFGTRILKTFKLPESHPKRDIMEVRIITNVWETNSLYAFSILEGLIKSNMCRYKLDDIYNYSVQCTLAPQEVQIPGDICYQLRVNLYVYPE